MDEIVAAALRKWPHVPACYGWLVLDQRGDWWMRDEPTQRRGPFETARGSRVEHAGLIAFIARNYDHDEQGAWFFQNGPQRVYVDLEVAPWVLRWPVGGGGWGMGGCGAGAQRPDRPPALVLHTHTGLAVEAERTPWTDEHGRLFFETRLGLGLVHTQDMHAAADAIEAGRCAEPQSLLYEDLRERAGWVLRPRKG